MKFNALRDGGVAVCFILLLLLIAIKVQTDAARTFNGRYRIVDGDSLALGGERFRLLGIDAPEFSQICTRDGKPWRCGEAARAALAALAGGTIDCKGSSRDKYRRLLVTCFSKGVNINRQMVLRGMAVDFGGYEPEERQARDAHAGLWVSNFSRPADWRRAHKAGLADDAPHAPSFLRKLFGGDG
jgi:endonuclease YncB( thermonuclease family)